MEAFSIKDCDILWNREVWISRSQKQAIKEELKTIWPKIRNALKFTGENQGGFVTFELDPKPESPSGFTVFMFFQESMTPSKHIGEFWFKAEPLPKNLLK